MPKEGEVGFHEEVIGLYRFNCAYPLYRQPESVSHATIFYKVTESTPHVMTTGKVYKYMGCIQAYQILYVEDEHAQLRWTIPSCMERIEEKDESTVNS